MARPTKDFDQRRSDQLNIRLTAGERVRLEHAAACLGITTAEYMRDRGLRYRMPTRAATRQADALALATLNRLGVNLNQMTHHLNAGWPLTSGTEAEFQALMADLRTAMQGLLRGSKINSRRPVL